MADKNFFDLFQNKLATLRPSDQYRSEDWVALGDKLDAALPQAPRKRRRAIVLPLLLAAALLSSNAMWWHTNRSNRSTLTRMETQLVEMQTTLSALKDASASMQRTVRHDTLWQTVYIHTREKALETPANLSQNIAESKTESLSGTPAIFNNINAIVGQNSPLISNKAALTSAGIKKHTPNRLLESATTSMAIRSDFPPVATRTTAFIQWQKNMILMPQGLALNPSQQVPSTKTITKKRIESFRPRFLRLGASAGLLYAASSGLMHEGGFHYNLNAEIGFSRHWSITAAYGAGQVHYKAHLPKAVLGTPVFPMLPSMNHHFVEIDVTGQGLQQYDLGLRYTFSQPGKNRAFLGLSWGGQILQPFSIQYEIQHEAYGTIEKNTFDITTRTSLKNIIGLEAGLDIPLSQRLSLKLGGFYQRSWKKPSAIAPDLTGLQTGINWLF